MENKPNEIDITNIDLDKLKEKTAENPSLLPYAHTVSGVVIKPEDKGKIRGRAMEAMYQQTDIQMAQIYQQMEVLVAQAKLLQNRKTISERIYEADIPFEPFIGRDYYLYKRNETQDVLSLIAPQEWGRRFKYMSFLAKVRLLSDHTWEVTEENPDFKEEIRR